ncbi:hypothetical protein AMD27_06810 [Acinetobacter sp. TGL-Y2]|uniref:hypothetical protein n=1 Tax=Acinetobacter sp. TGL-Y2 TaxID=1407071 RepID=UPI0007A673E9|nr:hypothetical protein [Acinetobacter sp. TGL-Y2]AMW78623.1 hypothetical protein AMD27_06810 [Acinetobacter sp. TGL-Y2]
MNNSGLLINRIIDKLISASDENQELSLSVEEVHELRKELGDTVFIPVMTMEEMAKKCESGEIGVSPFNHDK